MANDKNYGVITEQGFPAGQFGFDKLNEEANKKIKDDLEKQDKDKK